MAWQSKARFFRVVLAVGGLGATSASVRSVIETLMTGGSVVERSPPVESRRVKHPQTQRKKQRHVSSELPPSLRRPEHELNAPQNHQQQHMFNSEGWEGDAKVCDWEPFRKLGHDMIDYVADYFKRVETFPVRAQVKPGYLKKRLNEKDFPQKGEKWIDIMSDVESHIMPGITHWQHPSFFGYFPCNTCPPGVLADIVVNMLNVVSFSWEASPAATELEILVMDQLARALGLPDTFQSTGEGGGVIQASASETTLIGMLAARTKTLKHLRRRSPGSTDQELFTKMTFYTSDQAHSSILKTANIVGLGANLRIIPAKRGDAYGMDIQALKAAMREDRTKGLVPTFVAANVGSTNSCAVDNVRAMGKACRRCPEGEEANFWVPWLHVDAAYAGSAAVCPENRWIFDGIEAADSLGISLHKALLVNWDCAAMWAKRSADIVDALSMTPPYLMSEEYRRGEVTDFKDWQISLGRRCRSLKLWFTMRAYGLDKVRAFVRHYMKLALQLDALIKQDDRFELAAPTRFGLVTFRLKASDEANENLRSRIVASGEAFFSPTKLDGRTCLRVAIGATNTEERHIKKFWGNVQRVAGDVLAGEKNTTVFSEISNVVPGISSSPELAADV